MSVTRIPSGVRVTDAQGNIVNGVTDVTASAQYAVNNGHGSATLNAYITSFTYPVTFTYYGNPWDGVFNAMGLQAGKGTFINPALFPVGAVLVTATQSSDQDSTRTADKALDHLLDENYGSSHTQNITSSWWKVDFGSGRTFTPNQFVMWGRGGGSGQLTRNWKFQGSNDNSAWTDLLTITNDGPAAAQFWTSAVSGSTGYRYLRILQTGVTSSGGGNNYLTLGDVEMWGTLS